MLNAARLDAERAMLLVIDVQDKLLPLIDGKDRVIDAASLLVRAAELFRLPVMVTEQYPQGIGHTDAALAAVLERVRPSFIEKMAFSVCGEETARARLRDDDREQIIICGIEAHVCVQQTTLDLLTMDYQVTVCADAVGSRSAFDYDTALHRLRHAGAVVTTAESVLFELCERCGTDRFRAMLDIIKSRAPGRPSRITP